MFHEKKLRIKEKKNKEEIKNYNASRNKKKNTIQRISNEYHSDNISIWNKSYWNKTIQELSVEKKKFKEKQQ